MTHNIFWWNCKHIEVDNNLGVAFCTKNNDFCNKSKCTEIQVNPKKQYYRERMEELQNENEQLIQENKELKEERKGFESCSHNWGILYNEAKNKVEELSKENERLKFQLKECKNNKL